MFSKLLLHLRGKKGITRGEIFLLKSSSLIIPFGHIHLLVHGQPSSSMFSLHLVSYIALKVAFFKKIDHKKRTFDMWQRSGPWCNQPLEHQASWLCLGKLVCHGWRVSSKKKATIMSRARFIPIEPHRTDPMPISFFEVRACKSGRSKALSNYMMCTFHFPNERSLSECHKVEGLIIPYWPRYRLIRVSWLYFRIQISIQRL